MDFIQKKFVELNVDSQLNIQICMNSNGLYRLQVEKNQRKLKVIISQSFRNQIINLFNKSYSQKSFNTSLKINILKQLQNFESLKKDIQIQDGKLLGGGCGQSRVGVEDVAESVKKVNNRQLQKRRTNFKLDENFLEEYEKYKQECQEIILSMKEIKQSLTFNVIQVDNKEDNKANEDKKSEKSGTNRRSSLLNIPDDHQNDKQQYSMSKFSQYKKREEEEDSDSQGDGESEDQKNDQQASNNQGKQLTNKQEKNDKQVEKSNQKQDKIQDLDSQTKVEDEQGDEEQYNLRATIYQLEEFIYKYRKNFGDDVIKYKNFLIEIFETYLQFSFLSSNQSSCDAEDLINQQKAKIKEMKTILENQKNNQPSLDLVFYLHLFEKNRETDFVFPNTKKLDKFINSCKYLASKIQNLVVDAMKINKGQVITGIGDLFTNFDVIINEIDTMRQKKFFKLLFNISMQNVKANQKLTGKKIQNISNQVVFYISRFKDMFEENKIQDEKRLMIYYLLKISFLIEELLEIHEDIQEEKKLFLIESKVKEFQEQTLNLHTGEVNRFITILSQYVNNESLFDKFKQVINLQIKSVYFKFANLKLQINFRKLLIANQQESDPIFKLLSMSLFKQYIEETDDSVKILLYTDTSFQEFVNPKKKKKNPQNKNQLECNSQFIQEFIDLNQNWTPEKLEQDKLANVTGKVKSATKSIYSILKSNETQVNKLVAQAIK